MNKGRVIESARSRCDLPLLHDVRALTDERAEIEYAGANAKQHDPGTFLMTKKRLESVRE